MVKNVSDQEPQPVVVYDKLLSQSCFGKEMLPATDISNTSPCTVDVGTAVICMLRFTSKCAGWLVHTTS